MEKFPNTRRVVGGDIDNAHDSFAEERIQRFSQIEHLERLKTPEELHIIDLVNEATNLELIKYGVEPIEISPENILVINREDWDEFLSTLKLSMTASGYSSPVLGKIVVPTQRSNLEFLHIVLHETIHYKSYLAQQLLKKRIPETRELVDTDSALLYRSGLTILSRDGSTAYFKVLDEAITEELTKKIFSEISKSDPIFESENEENKISKEIKIGSYPAYKYYSTDIDRLLSIADVESGELFYVSESKVRAATFLYRLETKWLREVIQEIVKASNGKFKNGDEVFSLFVRGKLTGNILPIGKLIENTLGKGKFKELGNFDIEAYADKQNWSSW
jgi:hypothetical protein